MYNGHQLAAFEIAQDREAGPCSTGPRRIPPPTRQPVCWPAPGGGEGGAAGLVILVCGIPLRNRSLVTETKRTLGGGVNDTAGWVYWEEDLHGREQMYAVPVARAGQCDALGIFF